MSESKYEKHIVTELKKDLILPWGPPGVVREEYVPGRNRPLEHVLWLDGEMAPGCFYSECVWFFPFDPPSPEELERMREAGGGGGPQPHIHPFDEVFTFFGTNFDDPHDLGGEVEFWLEDQKFVFSKSCLVYIPAGMKHNPLHFRRMDRRMFHFSLGSSQVYEATVIEGSGEYAGQDLSKYFVFQEKPNLELPEYRHDIPRDVAHRVVYLDSEVVPGANFYAEAVWFWPGKRRPPQPGDEPGVKPHTHPFDEMIGFFGTDENDIHDLCGEVELWIGGEQYLIDKSFVAFIPAGVEHCPLNIRRIDRPIFHFTAGPGRIYE
jgi:mannose-6-phosphate isomerase-like protein (cupin superfamily)